MRSRSRRMWLRAAIGLAAMLALSAAATPAPTPTAAAPVTELQRRAQARIEAAQKRIDLVEAMYKRGLISLNELLEAKTLVFVAQRDSGVSGAALVAAATSYRNDLAKLTEAAKVRYDQGAITMADMAIANYRLAEAEYWLEEARSKGRSLTQ